MTPDLQPTPEEIYYTAEKYLSILPVDAQAKLRVLLERANTGEKVDNAIVALIAEEEAGRRWLRAAIFGDEINRLLGENKNFSNLPGDIGAIPANSVWVCPECGFLWHVSRAGRPVPPCPNDGETLVRKNRK